MLRSSFLDKIKQGFATNPIVAILGPRQVGKTTLAKDYLYSLNDVENSYFDLEDPEDHQLFDNPKILLQPLKGMIIIDEIQLKGDLFSLLRVLVDNDKAKKFLILGSASHQLIKDASESLGWQNILY